jgi:hypothetical protein
VHRAALLSHRPPALAVGDVEGDEARQRPALLPEPLGRLLAVLGIAVGQHEIYVSGRERARDTEAEAGYPAGDECRLAFEVHCATSRCAS